MVKEFFFMFELDMLGLKVNDDYMNVKELHEVVIIWDGRIYVTPKSEGVVIVFNITLMDGPFDPGCYGSKTKLESEFF